MYILDPSILFLSEHARVRWTNRFSLSKLNIRDLSKHLQSVGVHNGKSPKSGAFGERFDEKRGSWLEFDFSIFELGELWRVFDLSTSSLLSHLPQNLGHFACNLGGTREDHRAVTRLENTGVLLHGDERSEALDWLELTILFIVDDVSRRNLLILGNTLDGETNGVTWPGRFKDFLVLFNGENLLALKVAWANSLNVVNVGNRKTKRGIGKTLGGCDVVVEGINNGHTSNLLLGGLVSSPSLVPRAFGGINWVDQVVAVESGVWDERDFLWLETDGLKHFNKFILDFRETVLRPSAGVHLVNSDKNLFHTQKVEKTCVLTSLTFINSSLRV